MRRRKSDHETDGSLFQFLLGMFVNAGIWFFVFGSILALLDTVGFLPFNNYLLATLIIGMLMIQSRVEIHHD